MIADVFEDDSTPDERRFGRLRELCSQPAWTVKGAAWIICSFDNEGYRKGDYSHGESDGWMLLPGVTRERREPEPEGLPEEDLRQLRWERFQERCDTDEARHSRIGMTALRLAGLLNGGMQSAHPPRVILEKAVTAGIAPEWVDYARADPELAGRLPRAPAADPLHRRPDVPRKRRQADPCPIPVPEMIARWPKLHGRLEEGWEAGQWSSLKGRRALYPCYAHMLAFFQVHRSESDQEIADNLITKWPELKLAEKRITKAGVERKSSFGSSTIRGWRKLDVASVIVAWMLLGMQEVEPPAGLADLYALLTDAEDSA